MREIKFRIWQAGTSCFLGHGKEDFRVFSLLDWATYYAGLGQYYDSYPSYVFQQWTGLKDKNGVDIFEGDIVSFQYFMGEDAPKTTIEEVYFSDGIFWFGSGLGFAMNDVNFRDETLVVLGNIYKNPELLIKHD